jgi:hypothetical protein
MLSMRKVSIREIAKPRCSCGGDTRLKRVDQHPVYGIGYELRVFVCARCGTERTTETTPETASPIPPPRRSLWSLLTRR